MKSFIALLGLVASFFLADQGVHALEATKSIPVTPPPQNSQNFIAGTSTVNLPTHPPLPSVFSVPNSSSSERGSTTTNKAIASNHASVIPLDSNSCFDFYHFGDVQVNLASHTAKITAGTDLDLSGNITNNNPYPMVDGSVYIKVYKMGNYFSSADGGYLIGQFYASTSVTIPGNASVPISVTWHIPSYSTNGDYRIATYFVEGDSNLSGLSFTDDIMGDFYDFTVNSGQKNIIEFNKSKATFNGAPYQFVGFNPKIDKNIPVHINLPIANTTGSPDIVGIEWKVYSWDGLSDARLIASSTSTLVVPPGGASTSIAVFDTEHPVYYVVATLTYKDAKSIEGVRFVRNGVNQIRLEDPSLVAFPIEAGVPWAMFTCLHSMGTADQVSGGKLILSLTDRSGNIIASTTYQGLVTGSMMLRKSLFTPKTTYDYAQLSAKLYLNGKLQDQYTIVYDCKAIDPKTCNQPFAIVLDDLLKIGILLVLLGILGVAFYEWKRRKAK